MKVSTILKRSWRGLKRASPAILAVASGVGVVVTAVLSAKAAPRAMQISQEYEAAENNGEGKEARARRTVLDTCKCYAPAAISGVVTISCIFGAHVINQNRQKTLMGAYAALGAAFAKYKAQANMLFGENADKEIQSAVEKFDKKVSEDEATYTFIDRYREEPYEKTWSDVLAAEYNTNYQLQRDGYASLNDFYRWLDLPPIPGGDEAGWSFETLIDEVEICWIPFINSPYTLDDGMQMVSIEIAVEPTLRFID